MEKSLWWPPLLFHLFLIQMMCLDLRWNSVGRGHEIGTKDDIYSFEIPPCSSDSLSLCPTDLRMALPSSLFEMVPSPFLSKRENTSLNSLICPSVNLAAIVASIDCSLGATTIRVWDNFGLVCIARYRILLIRTRHAFSLSASLDKGCYSIVVNIYICSIKIKKCTSLLQHQTFLNHILRPCG